MIKLLFFVKPEFLEKIVALSLPKGVTAIRDDFTVPYEDSTKTFSGMKIILPKKMTATLYGPEFVMIQELLTDSIFMKSYKSIPQSTRTMFDKVTGTKKILKVI